MLRADRANRRERAAAWALVAACALTGCSSQPADDAVATGAGARVDPGEDAPPATRPGDTPRLPDILLYSAETAGNVDLWVLAGRGAEPRRLTNEPAFDGRGRFSPDGTLIAFQTARDGNDEVYTMRADGADPRNLSDHPGRDGMPVWSPDGTRLAFFSQRGLRPVPGGPVPGGPVPGHIWEIGADGAGLRRLTGRPLSSARGPTAWSSDGTEIWFARAAADGGQPTVHVLRLEGPGGRIVEEREVSRSWPEATDTNGAPGAGRGGGPLPSPDGTRYAVCRKMPSGSVVVVIDRATGAETALDGAGPSACPYAWSPDGERLGVTAIAADGRTEARELVLATNRSRILVPATLRGREPSWTPAPPLRAGSATGHRP